MKKASSILIPHKDYFLAVSRKDNSEMWGMPGGKVEGNESWLDAAIRELYEETRIVGEKYNLIPIYQHTSAGEEDYTTTTFLLNIPKYRMVEVINSAIPETGTQIAFLSREELESPRFSPFARYNRAMFHAYYDYRDKCSALGE